MPFVVFTEKENKNFKYYYELYFNQSPVSPFMLCLGSVAIGFMRAEHESSELVIDILLFDPLQTICYDSKPL